MAIYHFSAQVISRSAGRSAVAAAAYRAGERLEDERYGQVHDFSRKQGIAEREILAPDHAPEWVYDRQRLWNEVEQAEKRKDSQLCREFNAALPKELSASEQSRLIREYVQEQFVDRGMIADISIHRDNPDNPHAHVMLTMREITPDGFGAKNTEWNDKALLKSWREEWERYANRSLERENIQERIDHRSYADQGKELLPTIHEGHVVRQMEERGIRTERGDINREVRAYNAQVIDLEKYREEREKWRHFAPEEKRAVLKAVDTLNRFVDIPAIQQGRKNLSKQMSDLTDRETQLRESGATYYTADRQFERIAQLEKDMERFSGTKGLAIRMLNSTDRMAYERTMQELEKNRRAVSALGFQDRADFEQKRGQFEQNRVSETAEIGKERSQIETTRDILDRAESALKNAEIRRAMESYPQWEGAQKLSYEDARAINQLNEQADRVVQPSEIRAERDRLYESSSDIQKQLQAFRVTDDRLHGAKQWLEKYEKYGDQLQRLENPINKAKRMFNPEVQRNYADCRSELSKAERMMNQYGVRGREDFNQQVAQHDTVLKKTPVLEQRMKTLSPGLNLLNDVLKAFQGANNAIERERQQEQWRQQQRSRSRQQSHSRDEIE